MSALLASFSSPILISPVAKTQNCIHKCLYIYIRVANGGTEGLKMEFKGPIILVIVLVMKRSYDDTYILQKGRCASSQAARGSCSVSVSFFLVMKCGVFHLTDQ